MLRKGGGEVGPPAHEPADSQAHPQRGGDKKNGRGAEET